MLRGKPQQPQPQLLLQLLLLSQPQPQLLPPQQLKRMMIRMMSQIELLQLLLQNIFEPFLRAMLLNLPAGVHGRRRYIPDTV